MKIQLPKSDMPLIRLEVMCPDGSFQMTFGGEHTEAVFDIPDGVSEDAVEITAVWLDAGNKPVGDVMVLKEAVEPEPEPEDEDNVEAPDEGDEEEVEDAPDEVVDEEAAESPEKEVEVKELPAPRELGDHEVKDLPKPRAPWQQ